MDAEGLESEAPAGKKPAAPTEAVLESHAGTRSWRPSRVAAVAFLIGLAITAALVATTFYLYSRNENRLLTLRARELGLVLTAGVQPVQTSLASAAALADATDGSVQRFRALMEPQVGAGRQFSAASLWPLGRARLAPTATLGPAPPLSAAQARTLFMRDAHASSLHVLSRLGAQHPGIGYEYSTPGSGGRFAIYTESQLPKSRRSRLESNSAFSDLDYAVYLGRSQRTADLLVTSLARLPITARHASDSVAFGNSALTLVVTPRGSLGGTFFQALPWIVAAAGLLIALAAALLTDRLARGRQRAERLAGVLDRVAAENAQMYAEQRSIAQTLQHALLPESLPELNGLRVSARYVPAAAEVEVGGDWYDLVAAGDHRVLLMVGDVSGHGLRAATTMASVRHAALAYAALDSRPAAVLAKLSDYVNSTPHDYFATLLCVLIDVDAHQLTLASAGHPAPLLIDGAEGRFLKLDVGAPIGVVGAGEFRETSVSVEANATLIAFTDGLVERRGELIDTGLARLHDAATGQRLELDELVARLPRALVSEGHHDDTAIVGIQWLD